MNEHLAAAGRLLMGMTVAADDRQAGRSDDDIMALVAEDLLALYPDRSDESLIWGTVALVRLVDIAVSHAAYASGLSRAAMAREIVDKVEVLHSRDTAT